MGYEIDFSIKIRTGGDWGLLLHRISTTCAMCLSSRDAYADTALYSSIAPGWPV